LPISFASSSRYTADAAAVIVTRKSSVKITSKLALPIEIIIFVYYNFKKGVILMDISKLDKNLAVASQVTEPDLEWFNVLEQPFLVDGVYFNNDEERFLRMPREVAKTVNEGVYSLCKCTAGGSVRFKTDSSYIAISAVEPENVSSPHLTHIMKFGFDMYKDGTSGSS
jgi:hypothetical protein